LMQITLTDAAILQTLRQLRLPSSNHLKDFIELKSSTLALKVKALRD